MVDSRAPAAHAWLRAITLAAVLVLAPAAGSAGTASADPELTSAARLLAGLPSDYAPHAAFQSLAAWQSHREAIGRSWSDLRAQRLAAMERWRDAELAAAAATAGKNLVYPFSGPDFLNAYLLFPGYDTYVMFGLESPGEPPRIAGLGEREAAGYLRSLRVAVQDLIERNYFITQHMSKQLHTPQLKGVLPVIMASMALLDLDIAAIEPVEIAPADAARPRGKAIQAVKVTFSQARSGRAQVLYYLSLDATDRALERTPEFLSFLARFRPATTLIKSASYLLHGPYFTKTRAVLLGVTDTLVQDDTGIPFGMLQASGWSVRLYGDYEKPIRDFGRFGYQRDLESAYRSGRAAGRLPFPFGYHWSNGKSTLMVASAGARLP
ncbi:MAG: hypothetical protein N2544_03395 [Burkholderiales bacterium]|nr:hypothetical protein [Burkholderiales bacterium]